jgi:hypothetical protein
LAMADVNVGHKLNIHHKCGVAAKKWSWTLAVSSLRKLIGYSFQFCIFQLNMDNI